MAHLAPNAAIFSPSVARAAASAAKDWSFVDSWLQRKFPGRGPPPFERNPDTLRALLALALANEAADEERALLARLESDTLNQLRAREQQGKDEADDNDDDEEEEELNRSRRRSTGPKATTTTNKNPDKDNDDDVLGSARDAILTALEDALPREGQIALTALATLALQTGHVAPTASALGAELASLSAQSMALEQAVSRVEALAAYIEREVAATARLAAELRPQSPRRNGSGDNGSSGSDDDDDDDDAASNGVPGIPPLRTPIKQPAPGARTPARPAKTPRPHTGYHPPTDLSIQNLSLQRHIKALSARIPELRDRAAALARSFTAAIPTTATHAAGTGPSPTIQEVRALEEAYLELLAQKRSLDDKLKEFAGLPPDAGRARQEVEALRGELRRMTERRDEAFEGLVERESPRRVRRGR
ncbi:hypothetical protein VTJ83DRAFT_2975 [Remersonia thermophila]|uniref:Uncharacterized protein n=1 Tax=Remersonia thermophila TaxID=72144 RepID=A0ABR4DDN3_9PEZI